MNQQSPLTKFSIICATCEKHFNMLVQDARNGLSYDPMKQIGCIWVVLKSFCWFMQHDPRMNYYYRVKLPQPDNFYSLDPLKGQRDSGIVDVVSIYPLGLYRFYSPILLIVEYDIHESRIGVGYQVPDGVEWYAEHGLTFKQTKGMKWIEPALGENYRKPTMTETMLQAIFRLYQTGYLLRKENLYRGRLKRMPRYAKWEEKFRRKADAENVSGELSVLFK